MAGHLVYFLPFWEAIIHADHWVWEIIRHRILHRNDPTPKVPKGSGTHQTPLEGPLVLSNRVKDHLRKGVVVLTPLDQVRSGYYSTYFLVPKKDGGHRLILNLKFFNLNVCKTSFKMVTLLHHSHHAPTPVVGQRGSQGCVLPCMNGAPTPPVPHVPLARHQLPVLPFGLSSAP